MRRIVVIGTSCSGKTTFAHNLAQKHKLACIDLDDLWWLPEWTTRTEDDFRAQTTRALDAATDGWVVAGNYTAVRDIIWGRADTVIWLDLRFAVILWRALKRTAHRVVTRTPVCNGNVESMRKALSRDSIILWVITSHWKKKRETPAKLAAAAAAGKRTVRLRSAGDVKKFMETGVE